MHTCNGVYPADHYRHFYQHGISAAFRVVAGSRVAAIGMGIVLVVLGPDPGSTHACVSDGAEPVMTPPALKGVDPAGLGRVVPTAWQLTGPGNWLRG